MKDTFVFFMTSVQLQTPCEAGTVLHAREVKDKLVLFAANTEVGALPTVHAALLLPLLKHNYPVTFQVEVFDTVLPLISVRLPAL